MKKRRTLLAVAAAIAGFVALAGPAQALPPKAVPFSFDLPGSAISVEGLPAAGDNGYCPFPVRIDGVSNQKPTGPHNKVTGFGSATVTNLVTNETLSFNASGPGTITTTPSGGFTLDGTGPWLTWTTVANSFPGVPQLAYTTGHLQFSVAASGLTTSYKLKGRSTDVCAALS
jgi:hypothetical protein